MEGTSQQWGEIFITAFQVMVIFGGFLVLALSIRYCVLTFNYVKHVFLLLLIDLVTTVIFLISALVPIIMRLVSDEIQIACILRV